MDKHLDVLKSCCRLCGKKLVKGARKTKVQLLQEHIVKLWGQNNNNNNNNNYNK